MRKLYLHLAAVVLVLSACQKEVSLENPNGTPGTGGGATGTRLVRTGTRLGTDSITIDYSYNAANYLTGISYNGTLQGDPLVMQQSIKRNADNVITSVVVKSPLLLGLGYDRDTLSMQLIYDTGAGRYARSISNFVLDDDTYTDSTVYTYSASGKISSGTTYFSDGMSSDYFPYFKREYSFAENNLVESRFSVIGGTDFELEEVITFQHDSRVNPVPLPSEAQFLVLNNLYQFPLYFWFYIGLNDFYSINNMASSKVTFVSTSDSEETAVTYTYNSKNMPETAIRTLDGLPFAVTKYFYQ